MVVPGFMRHNALLPFNTEAVPKKFASMRCAGSSRSLYISSHPDRTVSMFQIKFEWIEERVQQVAQEISQAAMVLRSLCCIS
ncbi:MAG: hypothetical protein CV081_09275 [Nitrospira sp. LK265]|nr:hypothetical protein [Nitrospira sp. LK265]